MTITWCAACGAADSARSGPLLNSHTGRPASTRGYAARTPPLPFASAALSLSPPAAGQLPGGQLHGPVEHVGAILSAGDVVVDVVPHSGQVVGGHVRGCGERRCELVDFRRAGVPQLLVLSESVVDWHVDRCRDGREVGDPAADDLQQLGHWDR